MPAMAVADRNGNARNNRRPVWKRIVILTLGWVFLLAGIAGFFLPFLQGILFTLIGLYLLALESSRVRLMRQRLRRWLKDRYPEKMAKVEHMEERAKAWVREKFRRS